MMLHKAPSAWQQPIDMGFRRHENLEGLFLPPLLPPLAAAAPAPAPALVPITEC